MTVSGWLMRTSTGDNCLDWARRIGVNYNTARSIIRLWLRDGRVEVQQQGDALQAERSGHSKR